MSLPSQLACIRVIKVNVNDTNYVCLKFLKLTANSQTLLIRRGNIDLLTIIRSKFLFVQCVHDKIAYLLTSETPITLNTSSVMLEPSSNSTKMINILSTC